MTYVLCTPSTAAAGSAVVATGPAQSGSPQSEPQPSAPNESLPYESRAKAEHLRDVGAVGRPLGVEGGQHDDDRDRDRRAGQGAAPGR
jgi:hypothetical protein